MPTLVRLAAALAVVVLVAGCASRPINPPIEKYDRGSGYRLDTRKQKDADGSTLMVLAFSGGGTRAAAFAFGVLEELRRTEVTVGGTRMRMLDEVDIVTGVSGGSFTALAYALHGERLFDEYEQRFLKRDVQGELLMRTISPRNWPALYSEGWGRSELASELYDEILFENATFGDLVGRTGPFVVATATDISAGTRIAFTQDTFDIICSNVSAVKLSRAAAASSAVPLVLSPVTINNYGGTCDYRLPSWQRALLDPARETRPAGRAIQRLQELRELGDSRNRPYLHLVDGGISDNLGLRGVLESFEQIEASPGYRRALGVDKLKRIVVFVVNSLSIPKVDWDKHERPPNDLQILLKATGVPIDNYSYEGIELLKDIIARWDTMRELSEAGAFANAGNPAFARAAGIPKVELYAIDVSIEGHPSASEREFLNQTPTSFVLTGEQVDRLRKAAGEIMRNAPEYRRLLRDMGAAPAP
jgi:NTE family protein